MGAYIGQPTLTCTIAHTTPMRSAAIPHIYNLGAYIGQPSLTYACTWRRDRRLLAHRTSCHASALSPLPEAAAPPVLPSPSHPYNRSTPMGRRSTPTPTFPRQVTHPLQCHSTRIMWPYTPSLSYTHTPGGRPLLQHRRAMGLTTGQQSLTPRLQSAQGPSR